jgi:glutaredoxin-related protein
VLNKFASSAAAGTDNGAKPVKDLNARLKALVNSAPVMIFIKGTPQQVNAAQCVFWDLISNTMCSLVAVSLVNWSSY